MNNFAMTISRGVTRRNFLKRTACASAVVWAPTVIPASAFGASAPSNRINVGMIGLGNQSELDLPAFLQQDNVQLVAVCDVNTGSHGYRAPKKIIGDDEAAKMLGRPMRAPWTL